MQPDQNQKPGMGQGQQAPVMPGDVPQSPPAPVVPPAGDTPMTPPVPTPVPDGTGQAPEPNPAPQPDGGQQ